MGGSRIKFGMHLILFAFVAVAFDPPYIVDTNVRDHVLNLARGLGVLTFSQLLYGVALLSIDVQRDHSTLG